MYKPASRWWDVFKINVLAAKTGRLKVKLKPNAFGCGLNMLHSKWSSFCVIPKNPPDTRKEKAQTLLSSALLQILVHRQGHRPLRFGFKEPKFKKQFKLNAVLTFRIVNFPFWANNVFHLISANAKEVFKPATCTLFIVSNSSALIWSISHFPPPYSGPFCFIFKSPFNSAWEVFLALFTPVLLIGLLLLALLQQFAVVRFNIDSHLSC